MAAREMTGTPSLNLTTLCTEMIDAARYGDVEDVGKLLDGGVPINTTNAQGVTGLHMAAANGHLEVVRLLLQKGADVNVVNSDKNTPLHWAALNGHARVADALVRGGANPGALNDAERTPVDEAYQRDPPYQVVVDAINAAVASTDPPELRQPLAAELEVDESGA